MRTTRIQEYVPRNEYGEPMLQVPSHSGPIGNSKPAGKSDDEMLAHVITMIRDTLAALVATVNELAAKANSTPTATVESRPRQTKKPVTQFRNLLPATYTPEQLEQFARRLRG